MKSLLKSLACLLVLCLALPAFAGSIKEYTADMVDVKSGKVVAKYYVTEKKMRMESFDEEGEGSVSIIRVDQQMMYALQKNKTYLTIPFKGDKMPSMMEMPSLFFEKDGPQFKQEKVGSETVNGYQAEKIRATMTMDIMGQTHTATNYIWMAKEFDIPVRMQDEKKGKVVEMRNINKGAPADSLFEIPAGYRDMSKQMEEMMKSMKPQQGK
ncbi:MAG: DUF4412 domain-containing protein [Desulfobulbus sp.]|nr:DUF4412 domain-containing protein [Desulfobulbus sp.]